MIIYQSDTRYWPTVYLAKPAAELFCTFDESSVMTLPSRRLVSDVEASVDGDVGVCMKENIKQLNNQVQFSLKQPQV